MGDSSAHGLTDDHGSPKVLKAMSVVASEAHKVFPDIPIFPAIGNNDFPGHYVLLNNTNWYKTVLSHWASLILCSDCPRNVERPTTVEELTKTFLEDGYYKVNIAGEIQAFHWVSKEQQKSKGIQRKSKLQMWKRRKSKPNSPESHHGKKIKRKKPNPNQI